MNKKVLEINHILTTIFHPLVKFCKSSDTRTHLHYLLEQDQRKREKLLLLINFHLFEAVSLLLDIISMQFAI
jgi:hypothetical protein